MTTSDDDSGRTATGASHPDDLMDNVSKSTMSKTLPIALAAHFLLIALTSIGFLIKCAEYNSFYPDEAKAQIAQAAKDAKDAADREKYLKSLAEKEKDKGTKTKTKTQTKKTGTTGDERATGKSKIEQELAEVITTRPAATIDLGDDLD